MMGRTVVMAALAALGLAATILHAAPGTPEAKERWLSQASTSPPPASKAQPPAPSSVPVAIPQVAPAPSTEPAQARKTPAGDNQGMHTLNLKDADIRVLIGTVSDITGKNFIVDPRVEGK